MDDPVLKLPEAFCGAGVALPIVNGACGGLPTAAQVTNLPQTPSY